MIGLGSPSDWQTGTGSFYYIEDRRNERALPVFTTQEAVDQYIEQTLDRPEEHRGMLESIGLLRPPALAEGNFVVMPFAAEAVEEAAAKVGAHYLIRNPRPGDQQEIRRFSE